MRRVSLAGALLRIAGVMLVAFLANTAGGVLFEMGIDQTCGASNGPAGTGCGGVTLRLAAYILFAAATAAILLLPFSRSVIRLGNFDRLFHLPSLTDLAKWAAIALGIVLAVLVLLSLVSDARMTTAPDNILRGAGLMVLIAFFPGLTEELAYRWIVYDYAKRHVPRFYAAGLSGLLFGAIHLSQVDGWLDSLLLMAAGLSVTYLFAALYDWAGTIWAPVAMHWIWDMFFLHVGVTVASNHAPNGPLDRQAIDAAATQFLRIDYTFASPLISGGSFGVDSSPVAIAVFGLCAVWFWRRPHSRGAAQPAKA